MHNLDYSFSNNETGDFQQEWEYDGEQNAYGATQEWENNYETSGDGEYSDEYGYTGEWENEGYDGEMSDEIALATELLGVNDEYELDQFLCKWFDKAKRFAKKAGVYDMVADGLKSVAKNYLPVAAKLAGSVVGGPLGGTIAGAIADKGASMLGLELEGLSPEDKEFEMARRYVQFANEALGNVNQEDESLPDAAAARRALHRAAQRYAPGLLAPAQGAVQRDHTGGRSSGQWIRQGRNLVILNAY